MVLMKATQRFSFYEFRESSTVLAEIPVSQLFKLILTKRWLK